MYCEQLTLHHAANHRVEHHHVPKPANICSPLCLHSTLLQSRVCFTIYMTQPQTRLEKLSELPHQPQSQYNTPLPLLQEALRSFQESTWQTRTWKAAAHSPISASCSRSAEELILLEESRDWSKQKKNNNHTHPSGANWNLYSAPENTWVALQTRGYPPRALSFPFFLAARGSRSPPISARRRRRGPETHLRPVRWRYKPPSAQVTNIQTSSNYRGLAGALRMLRAQGFPTATLRKIKGKIY